MGGYVTPYPTCSDQPRRGASPGKQRYSELRFATHQVWSYDTQISIPGNRQFSIRSRPYASQPD